MGIKILGAIDICFYVFYLMILVRCLLSFFPVNFDNKFIRSFIDGVDMYLNLFRRFIPPIGPFDLSPILAFIALWILRQIVIYGLFYIFVILGIM